MRSLVAWLLEQVLDHYRKAIVGAAVAAIAWLAGHLVPVVDVALRGYIRDAVLGSVAAQFPKHAGDQADARRREEFAERLNGDIPLRVARAMLPDVEILSAGEDHLPSSTELIRRSLGIPMVGKNGRNQLIHVLRAQRDDFLDNIAGAVSLSVAQIELPVTKLAEQRIAERDATRAMHFREFSVHEISSLGVPVCGTSASEIASSREFAADVRFALIVPTVGKSNSNRNESSRAYFLYHLRYPTFEERIVASSDVTYGPRLYLELLNSRRRDGDDREAAKQRRKELLPSGYHEAVAIEVTELIELDRGGAIASPGVPLPDDTGSVRDDFRRSMFVFRFCFDERDVDGAILTAAKRMSKSPIEQKIARATISYAAIVNRPIDTTRLDALLRVNK